MSDEKPTSVRFDHICNVYNEMVQQAREEDGVLVYEGFLTKLFGSLDLAMPYYTLINKYLVPMGCVEQLRRGGSTTPSRWQLLREPTEESFISFDAVNRRGTTKYAILEQQVKDQGKMILAMNERLASLERKVQGYSVLL